MRRKRLARLSAIGGNAGDRPAASAVVTSPVPAAPVIREKAEVVKTQSQVSFEAVESMEVDPAAAALKRNRTTSSANYESSPGQILASLQTVLSVSLPGSDSSSPPGALSCPQALSL